MAEAPGRTPFHWQIARSSVRGAATLIKSAAVDALFRLCAGFIDWKAGDSAVYWRTRLLDFDFGAKDCGGGARAEDGRVVAHRNEREPIDGLARLDHLAVDDGVSFAARQEDGGQAV